MQVSKNSSFYSIKATLLVLQNNNYTHPIFAMLNEKKVKKTVENKKTCYYYYYYYYYRIIPDYTIILSRKKEIHIVIVLGHIFLGYILFHKLPYKCMFGGKDTVVGFLLRRIGPASILFVFSKSLVAVFQKSTSIHFLNAWI